MLYTSDTAHSRAADSRGFVAARVVRLGVRGGVAAAEVAAEVADGPAARVDGAGDRRGLADALNRTGAPLRVPPLARGEAAASDAEGAGRDHGGR